MTKLLTNVMSNMSTFAQDSVAAVSEPVVTAGPSAETVSAIADAASAGATALFTANNIWMMVATFLVFIMHLGFAGVEAGFGQSKNTVNILFKNTITPIIGLLTYLLIGFNLMYPGDFQYIARCQ